MGIYKRTIMQQSAVCILIFSALLLIKMNPLPTLAFTTNSVSYIVSCQSDWAGAFARIKSFVTEEILQKEQVEPELEPLAKMVAPVKTQVVSAFGKQTDSTSGRETFHYGVDFGGSEGEKIYCVADGIVEEIGYSEEYGNFILVKHGEKIASYYSYCDKILPAEGDEIKSGQIIATMGNSKETGLPCLHFEIREGDTSLDPAVFLENR